MDRVVLQKETVKNVSTLNIPNTKEGTKGEYSFESFSESFSVKVTKLSDRTIEFDLIGVDASFANALRRIIIAEVPTMAIEHIYMLNNTSIIADEILSHRLGLIPLNADPCLFDSVGEQGPTDSNTIVLELKVKCPKDQSVMSVYSRDIKWLPKGIQESANYKIKPIHDDILIAKLKPGQEIDLEMHCVKNIGKEHAKWSPVATCSYRLLPKIDILSPITGKDAEKFVSCFSPGVAGIKTVDKVKTAVILNPRNDLVSREVLRHKEFEGKVELSRQRDHFIFSVESVGMIRPQDIVTQALDILVNKCKSVKALISEDQMEE